MDEREFGEFIDQHFTREPSFTITSSGNTDDSVVAWLLLEHSA